VTVTNLLLATYSTTTGNINKEDDDPSKERLAAFLRQSGGHASRPKDVPVDNQQARQKIKRSDLNLPTQPPSRIETRIQQVKRQLFKSAREHQKANIEGKGNRTASDSSYQTMNHSVAPSSSNITFFPPILPPPNLTNSSTIILVVSAHSNFDNRQAIRETWAHGHDNVYFVVGHSNCHYEREESSKVDVVVVDDSDNCQAKDHAFLLQEQLQFRDLIEIPILEHYREIPEKVVQAYHWTIAHLPQAQWLVKVDDDVFVRVGSIEQYLIKYNSHVPLLLGLLRPQSLVHRTGKNAEVKYPYLYYPYWPQGSCGHMVSRATAEYLASNSPNLHRYQGEDVSIGIWLDEANKDHDHQLLPDLQYIHIPKLVSSAKVKACHVDAGTFFIVGHDLTPDDFQRCYDWNDEIPMPLVQVWEDAPADLPPPIRDLGSHPSSSSTGTLDPAKGTSGGGRSAAGTDPLAFNAANVGMPHGGTGSVLIDTPPLQNNSP
jgi:hypothetical protein